MSSKVYNPYPLGKVPKELQRPELDDLKNLGYHWNDPRDVIGMFEDKVAAFCGAKYAVSVDCCTHAIELSFRYLLSIGELNVKTKLKCPKHTYISAVFCPIQLGLDVELVDLKWSGIYQYEGSRVHDSAVRWTKDMFVGGDALQCLSFQIKKPICIGRGGMVLTNDKNASDWIKLASYDGRDLNTSYDSKNHVSLIGFHYYLSPEDCARGIILMDKVKFSGDSGSHENYPDVTQWVTNLK